MKCSARTLMRVEGLEQCEWSIIVQESLVIIFFLWWRPVSWITTRVELLLLHYETPPRVSTSKQMSHTLTGLFKSNLMMGISFIEHLWHSRRPQWRLQLKTGALIRETQSWAEKISTSLLTSDVFGLLHQTWQHIHSSWTHHTTGALWTTYLNTEKESTILDVLTTNYGQILI